MLNYLWGGMILIAVVYGTLTGRIEAVGTAAVNSSKEAVELCITMLGVMALWTGIMKIAEVSGLTKKFLRLARPVLRFLFPDVPEESSPAALCAHMRGLGVETAYDALLGHARHVFTHIIWEMDVPLLLADGCVPGERGMWVTAQELSALPLPTAVKAARKYAMERLVRSQERH